MRNCVIRSVLSLMALLTASSCREAPKTVSPFIGPIESVFRNRSIVLIIPTQEHNKAA